MAQKRLIDSYRYYLRLERALSDRTINEYLRIVNLYLDSGLTSREFHFANPSYNYLTALKSWNTFQSYNGSGNDSWLEFAQYPQTTSKIPTTLSNYELSCLLNAATSKRDLAIIETLYATGIRISELCAITLNDISESGLMIQKGKGDKQRIVPIHKKCRALLKSISKHPDKPLFSIGPKRINQIIKKLAVRAGIRKKLSAHSMRHTFATHLFANGADLFSIRDMLGHSDVKTTEIYLTTNTDLLRFQLMNYHPQWK